MSWILASVVMVAVAMIVLSRRFQKSEPAPTPFPYRRAGALFTPVERSFLGVLHQTVEGNAAIFGKVRVADVVEPESRLNPGDRQRAFNKISAKHFDFVLCNSKNLSVLCAIELDDASHRSNRRHQRDEFLKEVCEAAGVPLVHVPAQSGYVVEEVKRLIVPYLATKARSNPHPSPVHDGSRINRKLCPNCSATMVKRVAKKGSHAGREFWACSMFPNCKTVEAVTP